MEIVPLYTQWAGIRSVDRLSFNTLVEMGRNHPSFNEALYHFTNVIQEDDVEKLRLFLIAETMGPRLLSVMITLDGSSPRITNYILNVDGWWSAIEMLLNTDPSSLTTLWCSIPGFFLQVVRRYGDLKHRPGPLRDLLEPKLCTYQKDFDGFMFCSKLDLPLSLLHIMGEVLWGPLLPKEKTRVDNFYNLGQ